MQRIQNILRVGEGIGAGNAQIGYGRIAVEFAGTMAIQFSQKISQPHTAGDDHAITPRGARVISRVYFMNTLIAEIDLLSGLHDMPVVDILAQPDFDRSLEYAQAIRRCLLMNGEASAKRTQFALSDFNDERTHNRCAILICGNQNFTTYQLQSAFICREPDIDGGIGIENDAAAISKCDVAPLTDMSAFIGCPCPPGNFSSAHQPVLPANNMTTSVLMIWRRLRERRGVKTALATAEPSGEVSPLKRVLTVSICCQASL